MKSIVIGGVTRYFDEEGEGPAVILVHGSLSNARQWRKLSERLRTSFRVLSADLYSSDGAAGQGSFSFEQDCALIEGLIAMSGGRGHLLGHSYGGVVAMKVALSRRDALASLILIEPSCFHLLEQEQEPAFAEIADLRTRQQESARTGDMQASARGFIDYWMGKDAWSGMPENRRQMIALGVPKLAQDWLGAIGHNTRLADYRDFAVRTLVMRAADTRTPSLRIAELVSAALPNAERVEIAHGGHMSPLTNADAVNDAVTRFLGAVAK